MNLYIDNFDKRLLLPLTALQQPGSVTCRRQIRRSSHRGCCRIGRKMAAATTPATAALVPSRTAGMPQGDATKLPGRLCGICGSGLEVKDRQPLPSSSSDSAAAGGDHDDGHRSVGGRRTV